MKYPQLVSARAVNAISDWLVSRLERLGVDAPLVYSRLLLSLLHKPLQINALDLADIPVQLKLKGSGRNKNVSSGCGGHRHLTQNEAETLKRFAAVESLMDVTASDQLKTEVENLVDELCEKLREIEKQQNSLEIEQENYRAPEEPQIPKPEDLRKKYYRAFPSLSKEDNNRESSKMPLTWPAGSTKSGNKNTSGIGGTNKSISASTNNMNAGSNTVAGVKRKQKRRRNNHHNTTTALHHHPSSGFNKNYGRKIITSGEDDSLSMEKSSSLWDTNFEGTWEMGHDLIRDFILKQNKRNRCFSENNACSQYSSHDDEFDRQTEEVELVSPTDQNSTTPDTFVSFCDLSDNNILQEPRRLYQREISNESIDNSDSENFALFEAKFNSSVEALWDDKEPRPTATKEIPSMNANRNDLNLFWSNYYKHQYKPSATSLTTDCSIDLMAKKHDFIESGTNLQSSIWSNNPDTNESGGEPTGAGGGGFYAIDLWGKITANNKNEDLGVQNFAIENFSKWSDCSYEDSFIPNQTSSLNSADSHHQSFDYKSLPTPDKIADESNKIKKICNKVTLANHSETSGFQKVYPKTTNFYNYYDRQYRNSLDTNKKRYVQESALRADDENLLISERTHFRPIKQTYIDGFTFDIPCNVDDVKYTRSESGGLYFESEKYVEYKFQAENVNFLDGKRNLKRGPGHDNFSLKYCVRQIEKCCQTDDVPLYQANTILEPVNRVIGGEHSYRRSRNANKINFDDIEMELEREQTRILNYCICYEQKYDLNDDNDDAHNNIRDDDNNNNINPICSVHPLANDEIINWSLNKIKNSCANNNHSNHTLWGHCASCNNDTKSMPANRLLKDELSADGDEIMSDLKYMQNLFIGTNWNDVATADEDDAGGGNDDDDDDDDVDDDDDDVIVAVHLGDDNRNSSILIEHCDDHVIDDDLIEEVDEVHHLQHNNNNNNNNDLSIDNKHYDDEDDEEDEEMYCNINKLISDLLKPETAKSITQILGPSQGKTILEEIALNDRQQKQSEWYNFKNIFTNNNNNNNNIPNNNNNYITGDEIFGGLWKKYDNNNIGDWGNCKNLKSIIENQNEAEDDYDSDIYHNLNRNNKTEFEIITTAQSCFDGILDSDDNFYPDHLETAYCHNDIINNVNIKNNNNGLLAMVMDNSIQNNDNSINNLVKRGDRKRRHSASQNLGDDVLVHGKFSINTSEQYDVTATVITCKYWTNDAKILPKYDASEIGINPSSILKHVTMVSRPLTR